MKTLTKKLKTVVAKAPKKLSLIEKTNLLNQTQLTEICGMLRWTEQQYCDHQYEQYEAFLKRALFGAHPNIFNRVRYSTLMRGLWNNEWIRRNKGFLPLARYCMFEGMEVDKKGGLHQVSPDEEDLERVTDDYYTIHNGKLLYSNETLLIKFHHVLNLIYRSK
jgi:hypothetical protein